MWGCMKTGSGLCSKCERQGHNLFYVDNTAQVRRGLQGTLGEEYRADLVGIMFLIIPEQVGGSDIFIQKCEPICMIEM